MRKSAGISRDNIGLLNTWQGKNVNVQVDWKNDVWRIKNTPATHLFNFNPQAMKLS